MLRRILPIIALLMIIGYIYNFILILTEDGIYSDFEKDIKAINDRVEKLFLLASKNRKEFEELNVLSRSKLPRNKFQIGAGKLKSVTANNSKKEIFVGGEWPEAIPVLVFVCNRPTAIKNHLDKLIRYRPSKNRFPIIISQDCDNEDVANVVKSYGDEVDYIKHKSEMDEVNHTVIRKNFSPQYFIVYYRISRHYKLGLSYVFDKLKHTSVIITEDDLDISADFFDYFSATRHLLKLDPSLYCISAWNDNGKLDLIDAEDRSLLYRSDFFPGLGWMMSSTLWSEFGPIWPDGFWDDWIRDPLRRKDRACIRPEVPRTGMTKEGQKGASRGLFYDSFLANIKVNEKPVKFTQLNLNYLLKENYDRSFLEKVYSSKLLPSYKSLSLIENKSPRKTFRLEYRTMDEYVQFTRVSGIMRDAKAGVPRTAYLGIVTCFINGIRIYIAPNRAFWKTYDPLWEAPRV